MTVSFPAFCSLLPYWYDLFIKVTVFFYNLDEELAVIDDLLASEGVTLPESGVTDTFLSPSMVRQMPTSPRAMRRVYLVTY